MTTYTLDLTSPTFGSILDGPFSELSDARNRAIKYVQNSVPVRAHDRRLPDTWARVLDALPSLGVLDTLTMPDGGKVTIYQGGE